MYAFGNRNDMTVIDEPFYAYYLHNHPSIDHPGRVEVLESQPTDYQTVIKKAVLQPITTDYLFVKNMAHHLDGSDWSFLTSVKNIFLIREPRQLIASFAQVIHEPKILDIGLKLEYEIFEYLRAQGQKPIVIDSGMLLQDPETYLKQLCNKLDIPFSDKMLNWSPGPRKEDGIWAKYWYDNVHASSGFRKQKTSERLFPEHLLSLLEEADFYYNQLSQYRLEIC